MFHQISNKTTNLGHLAPNIWYRDLKLHFVCDRV